MQAKNPSKETGHRVASDLYEGDAKTTAAVPDLLEACKFALIRALQTSDQDSELVNKLQSAIAKAEGREP